MQAFAVQLNSAWEDPAANFARVTQMVDKVHPAPGSLLVLPEMFATGYSMHVDLVAEPIGGATEQFLSALAVRSGCYVCGGVAVRVESDQPPFNQSLIFNPAGELLVRYAKQQLFTLGTEREYYRAGAVGELARCGEFLVAPRVCYDLRFPELFRADALAGAEVLLVIANWPQARAAHWRALLQARAIENQAYVVGVNRAGNDPLLQYCGQSIIFDPQGNALAAADKDECVISASLDRRAVVDYRRKFPALADTDTRHFAAVVNPQSRIGGTKPPDNLP